MIDLLFLHATGFNAQTYQPLLVLLPGDITSVAWDLRGHGHNPLPANPAKLVSWQTYANDVIAGLVALKQPPLVLAGHSMGAVVSLLVAAQRPDLVRGVVMIDPPMPPPRFRLYAHLPGGIALLKNIPIAKAAGKRRAVFPTYDAVLAAYTGRGAFKTWQPGFLENYLDGGLVHLEDGSVRLACAPAWEQATFTSFRHNSWGALKKLTAPLHLLVGSRNSTIAASLLAFLRAAPRATHEIVPGSSHFIPMEEPQLVADRLRAMVHQPQQAKT
jgi:pimeloyl-ACP methyl ester carboxylesterase